MKKQMFSESESFTKNVVITFFTRVFNASVQLFFRIGLAFLIDPVSQGNFFWFVQTYTFFSYFSGMGTGTSSIYHLSKQADKQDTIISSTIISGLLYGLICILPLWLIFKHCPIVTEGHTSFFSIVAIAGVLYLTVQNGLFLLLGTTQNRLYNMSTVLQSLLQTGIFLILFAIGNNGLHSAVSSTIAALLGTTFFIHYRLLGKVSFKFILFDKEFLKRFQYGIKTWFSSIITFLNFRIDFFMVQSILKSYDAGCYSVATMMAEILWFVPDAVSTILFPVASRMQDHENSKFGEAVCRHTIILSMLLCFPVLSAGILLFLFVPKYSLSLLPFLVLFPGVIVFNVSKVLSTLIISKGKVAITNIGSLILLFINISGNFYLIPRFGMAGAAFSSTFAYFIGTLIAVWYYSKISNSKPFDFLLPRMSDLRLLTGLILKKFRALRGQSES
jgi:O-antigen/teichoic acid export membrane protein